MFVSPFQSPFQSPFPSETITAEDWWLSGGISAGDCAGAYQAKGAASLAASYSNLNNPGTYDLALGVAPTWDSANGWSFTGTQYLKTGIIPTSQAWSYIVRYSDASAFYQLAARNSNGVRVFLYGYPSGSNVIIYQNGNTQSVITTRLASATLAIAGSNAYRNGVDEGLTLTSWTGDMGIADLYIGAMDKYGANAENFYIGKVQSISIYNVIITPPQVLAVTNAMNLL